MLYASLVNQASNLSFDILKEQTFVTGIGEVFGIVDRIAYDRNLKKGFSGGESDGKVTIVYQRTEEKFVELTTDVLRKLREASIKVPSIASSSMGVDSVEYDDFWITFVVSARN